MKRILLLLAAAVLAASCAGTPPAEPVEPQPDEAAETAPPEPVESTPPEAAITPPPADAPAAGPAVLSEPPPKAPSGSTVTAVTLPPPRLSPSPPPPYPWTKTLEAPPAVPVADYTPADPAPAQPAEPVEPAAQPREAPPPEESFPAIEEPPADRENGSGAQNLETLRVPPGEPFDYAMEGQGWIYDGSSPAGVRFIKRTVPSSTTEFTFLVEEEGIYTLTFLYNDIISGLSETAVLTLEVGYPEETPPGEWEADLSLPVEEPEPGPPTVEEVVALGFYESLREADEALKGGNDLRALDILNAALRRFADSRDLDRILFALASLYEKSGPLRDLDKALGLYKRLTEDYPASIFYNRAAERITYIERNFIRIR